MSALPRRVLALALAAVLTGLAVDAGSAGPAVGVVSVSTAGGDSTPAEPPGASPGPANAEPAPPGPDAAAEPGEPPAEPPPQPPAEPPGGPTRMTGPFSDVVAGGLPGERPNIVVIMADDMRQDELAWMPNVRRLIGARGVELTNSFSPYPLCCPARSSFLTGRYTHNHGVWSNRPPYGFSALDDSDTLATRLSRVGYQTGFLGKYLNGYGIATASDMGGASAHYVPPGWSDWRASVSRSFAEGTDQAGGTYNYFSTTLNHNGTLRGYPRVYQTRVLGQEAEDMVGRFARSSRPFFLWASYVAPHDGGPVEGDDPLPVQRADGSVIRVKTPARPPDVRGMLDEEITAPLGAVRENDMRDKPSFLRGAPPLNAAESASLTTLTRQRAESLYVLDQEVARTVEALEQAGELDDTVLVFASDNGFILGEHGILTNKRRPYDAALRVPTLVAGPGIPSGQVRHDPFLTIDFAPTFLDLAGAGTVRGVDGVSMVDVLRSGDRGWTRPVFVEVGPQRPPRDARRVLTDPDGPSPPRFSQGVRTARYLYVEHATDEQELYDLRTDPQQLENIVDEPSARGVVRRLEAVLDRLRSCRGEACAAPLPPTLRER